MKFCMTAAVAASIVLAVACPAIAAETSGTAAAAPASDGKMVPLQLSLPKPMFVGTPKNIKVENLEAPGQTRTPVMIPEGAKNIALKKPVTASDKEPTIGTLDQITDGDKEAAEGSFVELGTGPQWVQIDLKEKSNIYAVAVWHYHQQARVYNDVIVKISDDPDFIENVTTVYNNDHDNSAKQGVGKDKSYIETNEGRVIDAKGAKGRYVRLYSNGNTSNEMNHYIEVEVYGTPAK